MSIETPFLEEARAHLAEHVSPHANEMDCDPAAMRAALDGLCARGWMALKRPQEFGGPEMDEAEFRCFQELIAQHSGALAFLQTQHQSAVSILSKSTNPELRGRTLPHMHAGSLLIGLGFSQLRRPGPPILEAEECDGGYRLQGHVPWITGMGFFHKYLIGASLPDGRSVFGMVSFVPGEDEGTTFSEPMKLAAMEGAQTVTADITTHFLKDEDVVFVKRPGWIETNDMINITLQGWFALGCARGGLDIVLKGYEKKKADFIKAAHDALEAERQACRAAMARVEDSEEERLKTRAWGIDLAVRCAHAAIVASGGAANSLFHPAQRVYREALVFSVSAQTGPIMEASLARLSRA